MRKFNEINYNAKCLIFRLNNNLVNFGRRNLIIELLDLT
jgi:hypothetical protein